MPSATSDPAQVATKRRRELASARPLAPKPITRVPEAGLIGWREIRTFIDPGTRAEIRARGISVWLRADLDLLIRRTARRNNRPLLNVSDPQAKLAELMAQRYPIYAEADITIDSDDSPPEATVDRVIAALQERFADEAEPQGSAA